MVREIISAFIAHIPERGKVLTDDVRIAKELSEKGFDVLCITKHPEPKVTCYNYDIHHLPFYANSFDAAWLQEVPENISTLLVIGGVIVAKQRIFDELETVEGFVLSRKT